MIFQPSGCERRRAHPRLAEVTTIARGFRLGAFLKGRTIWREQVLAPRSPMAPGEAAKTKTDWPMRSCVSQAAIDIDHLSGHPFRSRIGEWPHHPDCHAA
jgi:hypothetical protein